MKWFRTDERKPKGTKPVLGYWTGSKAFFMVIYDNRVWRMTTGQWVPQPTFWAVPEPPV